MNIERKRPYIRKKVSRGTKQLSYQERKHINDLHWLEGRSVTYIEKEVRMGPIVIERHLEPSYQEYLDKYSEN